ncbi:MAG: prepilin-type N-terminal cleavage/methylation domain-containing protein [Pirellulales bacterium]
MTQRTNHSMRKAWGFTLIEVLIATVITLLMMAALAEGFKRLSDGISKGA